MEMTLLTRDVSSSIICLFIGEPMDKYHCFFKRSYLPVHRISILH
jgi:hypothetical protein